MAETLFYLLALGAVGFGIGVVSARMPLFSVLSLLGTFFCLAGIYLLAGFQFLAATQLLVYAGAIMVLFLFVIMLLNLGDVSQLEKHTGFALRGKRMGFAAGAAGLLALSGILSVGFARTEAEAPALLEGLDDLEGIAEVLFSRYMLPFEAASLLLLATMIGVIALAKRQRGAQPQADESWPFTKEARP